MLTEGKGAEDAEGTRSQFLELGSHVSSSQCVAFVCCCLVVVAVVESDEG